MPSNEKKGRRVRITKPDPKKPVVAQEGEDDLLFYLNQLRSEECYCGRTKKYGFALCYGCWKQLDAETQKHLFRQITRGFEEAFDRAIKELERIGRL